MPSGSLEAYKNIKSFLETIAAKDKNKLPCCTYIGPQGSGHFVKMVHNGIEYVEMQLLAEVFSILLANGKNQDEIATILESWKDTANSYLLEITTDILRKKEDGDWLLKKILDKAATKGTGNWGVIASANLGVASSLLTAALFARYISFNKEERIVHQKNFRKRDRQQLEVVINDVFEAYQFARIINHYQGFRLLAEASATYSWNLNISQIARIWTSGCIIKSNLIEDLVAIFQESHHLLENSQIIEHLTLLKPAAKSLVSQCVLHEISVPCLSESIQFFNGITTANSSANIIQAQRDYFGAHTYQKVDDVGRNWHTNWKS